MQHGKFARRLGEASQPADVLAERTHSGFARCWNEAVGYGYDVIDGPGGNDPTLRPNQLFAVALPRSPLREATASCPAIPIQGTASTCLVCPQPSRGAGWADVGMPTN